MTTTIPPHAPGSVAHSTASDVPYRMSPASSTSAPLPANGEAPDTVTPLIESNNAAAIPCAMDHAHEAMLAAQRQVQAAVSATDNNLQAHLSVLTQAMHQALQTQNDRVNQALAQAQAATAAAAGAMASKPASPPPVVPTTTRATR